MHVAIVLIIALTGLGCQNKGCNGNDPQPAYRPAGGGYTFAGPCFYDAIPAARSDNVPGNDWGAGGTWDPYPNARAVLRSTLDSFVLGRDRWVATPRQIEASVYGNGAEYP
jgi:hypothetical protein